MKAARTAAFLAVAVLVGAAAARAGDGGNPDDFETRQDRRPKFETQGDVLLRGATVLTVTRGTVENGSVLVRGGKIAAIGVDLEAPEGVPVLDCAGLFVMPGIIDCHAHIAIDGGVNEGSQSVVPEVRIADEVDPHDVAIYRALAGGTTTANLLHGSANVVGGQNAVVKLRYETTPEEMLIDDAPRGVKFALGENVKRSNGRGERNDRYPNTRMGVETVLRRAFEDAREYEEEWRRHEERRSAGEPALPPRRDLRLEALLDILYGRILVHSHCYRADEILMLLRVAEDYGFRVRTLQHVLEGYKVAPEIARHGAGPSTFADWWSYKMEAYDAIPYNASLLTLAGASASVNSDSADLMRRLNHEAAKSLRYGNLPEEETLALVTLNPAKQLGIDHRVGSLEVGKDGDLAVFNGHPLSVYSRCEYTFIEGECFFQRGREQDLNPTGPEFGPIPCPDPSELPVPGDGGVYALRGATLYTLVGDPIEHGTLVIRDGLIEAVGPDVPVPADAERIDVRGLSVYPGLFEAATTLGLGEIGSVAGTRDERELGVNQPDVRVTVAYHPDSAHIPVTRCGGITHALVLPDGEGICGQASVMQLDGWTWEEATVEDRAALVVRFPAVEDDEDPVQALEKEEVKELAGWFERARAYRDAQQWAADRGMPQPLRDLRLEAMLPYVEGQRPVLFRVQGRNEIRAAVLFAEKQEVNPVLLGVRDGWLVTEFLAEHQVPCLVGPVLTYPRDEDVRYDAPFQCPRRLYEAGIPMGIVSFEQENVRDLPFHAGAAAAYGLPREEALRAVTLRPAQILGVDDRLGTLEPGKLANIIVTDGDPLELRTHVRYEFIAGRPVALESKHTRLYETYKGRILAMQPAASAPEAITAPAAGAGGR